MAKKDKATTEKKDDKIENESVEEKEEKENPVDETADEIQKLKDELAAKNDLLLRTAAEYDNYKKRTAREMERIGSDTRVAILKQLLPAVDNFLRADENPDKDNDDYKKGVEMSIRNFMDILTKIGLTEMDCKGKPFDPNFHFAVSQVEDENLEPNTVAEVFQKGYMLGDSVVRTAMVSVANCD